MTNEDRYRQALERIVNLTHDQACNGCAPLHECGCYEKSPSELARMALDGVDWEPESRKSRALSHFDGYEAGTDDFARAMCLCRSVLERQGDECFEKQCLESYAVYDLVVQCMTDEEREKLVELTANDGVNLFEFELAKYGYGKKSRGVEI